MKSIRGFSFVFLSWAMLAAPIHRTIAQSDDETLDLVRSVIQADRHETVSTALQLTDAEAEKFWPLYHQYRVEMELIGDGLLELIENYAFHYPNVPEDRAKAMLKELLALEKKQVTTRARFLKTFGRILPPDRNLRFAQVENRLDLAIRLRLAAGIPLVPVKGRFTGTATEAAAVVEGQAGGAMVRTVEILATVILIDKANRKVTLLGPDGFKTTVKAGPDVVNFDQIRVGDQLEVTATEELVVSLASPDEDLEEGADAVVALAPVGAKPGGLAAETVQVIGTVTAIDVDDRTATLECADGTTRTFPVREDVDLRRRKVGEKVVFQLTEMIAIRLEKP